MGRVRFLIGKQTGEDYQKTNQGTVAQKKKGKWGFKKKKNSLGQER